MAGPNYLETGRNPELPEGITKSENPLQGLIESGQVWLGADLLCAQRIVVRPGQTMMVELQIPDAGLPPDPVSQRNAGRLVRDALFLSVRSRFALLGLTEDSKVNRTVRRVVDSQQTKTTVRLVSLGIKGLGWRPVELLQGEGLGCFFTPIGGQCLQGQELFNTACRIVDGKFGRDWSLVIPRFRSYATTRSEFASEATAIALRLSKKRLMIPRSDEPISLSRIVDYRDYLDKHVFKPIGRKTEPPDFWVGETKVPVNLPEEERLVGILEGAAYENGHWVIQTESRLMKPGQTDWPIRYEFYRPYSRTRPEPADLRGQGTQFLVMQLFKQP